MARDPFTDASQGSFDSKALKGRLLLITPLEYIEHITVPHGESDAVRADYVVLDGPDAPEEVENALIFPSVLVGNLKGRIGKGMIIGRLGQKPTNKGNPAWVLEPSTDDDKDVARTYLRRFSDASPV